MLLAHNTHHLLSHAASHRNTAAIGYKNNGGVKFFHYQCIIIANTATIGENCSIHQGVTIGRSFAGKYAGVPSIGNNVVIFAGAKIIGAVKIGNNAVIGANAVVTKDVPDDSVVAGIPAKVISENSSMCFTDDWAHFFAR